MSTPTPEHSLTVTGKWKGLDVRATGMYAVSFLAAVGLVLIMMLADPMHNPQHFVVAMLNSFVGGVLLGIGVMRGRINDALENRDAFRIEMNNIASRHKELNSIVLQKPLSSNVPNATPEKELPPKTEASNSNASQNVKPPKQSAKAKSGR